MEHGLVSAEPLDLAAVEGYRCNVCGEWSAADFSTFKRGAPACETCGSTPRFRSVVHALSLGLFGESLALSEFPHRPELSGIGMSDWGGYALPLREKYSYLNTYYHAAPGLDITDIDPALEQTADFVISSEVFEHIAPPVSIAFENVLRLLKPGGLFVLTTPYRLGGETIEHYPNLHDHEIVTTQDGRQILLNRTREGAVEAFDNLVFHGGPGSTLEMRIFTLASLVAHLTAAGFDEITLCVQDRRFGVCWSPANSFPILARKPR